MLPTLTAEDRAAALAKASQVRAERAEVKKLLKQGTTTLPDILKRAATDDAVAKMKVLALVESMPGVGKVRAAQIMERLAIDSKRRVRGLGANQRQALEAEFAAA
jgi:S13-like H2TH domain